MYTFIIGGIVVLTSQQLTFPKSDLAAAGWDVGRDIASKRGYLFNFSGCSEQRMGNFSPNTS